MSDKPFAAVGVYRLRIAFTYALTLVENLIELLYPWATGVAIDGLLGQRGWQALLPLAVIWLVHIAAGIGRHLYDTRLFTRIYAEIVTAMVLRQRADGAGTAEVAARATMGRELVDFFEHDVPGIAKAALGLVGGVAMLFFYDPVTGLVMTALLVPIALVNGIYGRHARRLNRGLNDETEREVDVIAAATGPRTSAHFQALRSWRVRISNAEAATWSIVQLLGMAAAMLVLVRTTGQPQVQAGEIYAMIAYLWRVLESLDEVPLIVQQMGRLLDIRRRIVQRGAA
ncbi:MAG: ABC transporter six-transmembrane domain-containing protein [Geminicoccaceae bacterium]